MKVLAILANQFKRRESLLEIAFLTAVGSKYVVYICSIMMRKGWYQGMISRYDIKVWYQGIKGNNENYVREPR